MKRSRWELEQHAGVVTPQFALHKRFARRELEPERLGALQDAPLASPAIAFLPLVLTALLFLAGCTTTAPGALATPYPPLPRPLPTLTPGVAGPAEFFPKERPVASRGQERYKALCENCHGETGRGDTALARTLAPRPANFHDLEFLRRRTPSSLYRSISKGVLGTAMLAYEGQLSEAQRWDVLAYLWSFHTQADEIASGQRLYAQYCVVCHGRQGESGGPMVGFAALSDPATLASRTGYSIFNALSGGLPHPIQGSLPQPVGHEWSQLSETDRWSIVEYVWTFMFAQE